VLSDGTWAAVTSELQTIVPRNAAPQRDAYVKVITSTDGGETLNQAVTVSNTHNAMTAGNSMPMMAADVHSAVFKDRLYVVYSDRLGERFHLMVSYSTDRGKSWSQPRVVTDGLRYPEAGDLARHAGKFAVAANRNGVVGVLWEDRRDNQVSEEEFDIRFTASLDGGDTWTPSVKVADKPPITLASERWYASVNEEPWVSKTMFEVSRFTDGGHTIGLDADAAGVFRPIWVDSRTGIAQLWTATITVSGTPVRFGSATLANLTDITRQVKIEVLGSSYDSLTQRVSVRTRLRNESTDTIAGVAVVRALLMLSEATATGTARVVGADNQIRDAGATWDFSRLLPRGGLVPKGVTGERTLVFELASLRPVGPG
jgi:hypothetical protein